MGVIGDWLKKQAAVISFALANVEKNAIGQKGNELENNINQEQRNTQGTLADSLVNGVITADVENLRWRMYKILEAAQAYKTNVTFENGKEVIDYVKNNKNISLIKTKIDTFDDYKLEMVVNNDPIVIGSFDLLDDDNIIYNNKPIINYNEKGEEISATHGEIKGVSSYVNRSKRPIIIGRESLPKFLIEDYTKKLNVRIINETERLLEFYVSSYPDEENRNTRLLISDIKKAITAPRHYNMLDIKEIGFITFDTIGVNNYLMYQYDNVVFDKIIEFNGFYVIKFKSKIVINGLNILEEYRVKSLDVKYENKERKRQ